ncbi:MAG: LysM peptidoglycan-binding domain-containing protein, partial [Acidobacteriaceae bacterium]
PVLEMLRMLSNFETPREKLIQIILAGQPQFASKMASPELEQLRQRITIFSYLKPLSHEEAELYIAHRLRIAGYDFESPLFSREALSMIADCSNGVPRNINNLCFNALSLGCALKRCPIDSPVLSEVFNDLDSKRQRQKPVLTGQLVPPGASWKTPAFALARNGNAGFAGWTRKFAVGLVALLASTALYFAAHRQLTQKAGAVHAESFASAPATSSSSATGEQQPPATDGVKTVTVQPGETLFAICLATFGRCDSELLQNLRRLNSGLVNPDHIEVGQSIRIPTWDAGLQNLPDKQEDTP